jgi:SAM-dependent methyltransferase/tetratricopeptide (TPR) repeat protein
VNGARHIYIERGGRLTKVHATFRNDAVQGNIAAAARAFEQALALAPEQPRPAEFARIFLSLANLAKDRQDWTGAAPLYRRALAIDPALAQAYNDYGAMLLASGELAAASAQLAKALALTPELFESYGDLVATLYKVNPPLGAAVERANAAWPERVPAQVLLGADCLAALAVDPMLATLLESATVRDVGLERLLTSLRRSLLDGALADAGGAADDPTLAFCCALARQCFINEYVFEPLPDELHKVEQLERVVVDAVASGAAVRPLRLAALASYRALSSVADATRLLERDWPKPVALLATQQIREPMQELALLPSIARLTPIVDAASLQVQRQYEENPYPRWVLAPSRQAPVSLAEDLRSRFPNASFGIPDAGNGIDILIAGCGTGQHPIGMAQRYRGSRVLAIDLSATSLCYAQRKCRELGIGSIEYAQADILELASIGRRFDLIDAGGVLHHLADPWAGWRVLCGQLRPRGLMRIGLYSERGRADVVAARAFIAERGYQPTATDIRGCRQDLMRMELSRLAKFHDFFSTSECRDLLFHVQEHRFGIPAIGEFLRTQSLRFIGFELDAVRLHAYRSRFPGDEAMNDLGRWDEFESERPDTFASMYQFWVQAG